MCASAFPPPCAFSANPLGGLRRLLEYSSSAHDLRSLEHLDRGDFRETISRATESNHTCTIATRERFTKRPLARARTLRDNPTR